MDCHSRMYQPLGQPAKPICVFGSRIGDITTSSEVLTSIVRQDSLVKLHGPYYQSYFLPSNDSSISLVAISTPSTGSNIGIYHALSRHMLHLQITANQGTYYEITDQPDAIIHNPQTGQQLQIDTTSMAQSANGQWLVANVPHKGIARVNLLDLSVALFARPVEPPSYGGLANMQLAVSNDGRYVAANTDIFGSGNITVYDVTTCDSQLNVLQDQHFCSAKDIWHGETLDAHRTDAGLLASQPDMMRPSNIRFIDNDNIRFDAVYATQSVTVYKTARFVATAPNSVRHKIGLLGLGDSYISGQGAFVYRAGSDTGINACHLSELAYPNLIGKNRFNSYNSAACSGAVTQDVIGSSMVYEGQVKDGVKESDRTNKQQILANFLPGYLYQQEFASTYLPEAMVLSVGGDDIGFADIVKKCVANSGGGTCYDTYEERAELLQTIDDTYDKLVRTYQTLREQSGGARLYVIGYPQVAKPGGNCGANVHLNAAELTFASQLVTYLDGVVQRAAMTAGVAYVDTQAAFDGHRLCEPGQKAVNGFTIGDDAGVNIKGKQIQFIGSESYHPTAYGYRLLADAIEKTTNGLHSAMPSESQYEKPSYSSDTPMLKDMTNPHAPSRHVVYDPSLSAPVVERGIPQKIGINGVGAQIASGGAYQVVLHSDPIVLGEGHADNDGDIDTEVTLPVDVEPGYHTLHVYATDMSGQALDIQRILYVAGSGTDLDGDAIADQNQACSIVQASGMDIDGDGTDDACDAEIGQAKPTVAVTAHISASAELSPNDQGYSKDIKHSQMASDDKEPPMQGILGIDTESPVASSTPEKVITYNRVAIKKLHWLPTISVLILISGIGALAGMRFTKKP